MITNRSLLDYYPKDNSKYIDHIYRPYQEVNVPLNDRGEEGQCYHSINPRKELNCVGSMYHPEHIRKDWEWDFMNMYSQDPCPPGFSKTQTGHCIRNFKESHLSNFYTNNFFGAKHQYHNYYGLSPENNKVNRLRNLEGIKANENYSINPWSGKPIIYHNSKPTEHYGKYSYVPSKHSYMGI